MAHTTVARADFVTAGVLAEFLEAEKIDVALSPLASPFGAAVERVELIVAREDLPLALTVIEEVRRQYPGMRVDFTDARDLPPTI